MPYKNAGAMTVEEIALAAAAKHEQDKEFAQLLAWIMYNNAALTGVAVNDPKKFPAIEEAFPSLFEKKEQQDWWVMKERIESYGKVKKHG